MVNTEDFTKRLQNIMTYLGLSASGFADKIGVQRSSISHILSGRNKPSLEFIMKVLSSIPEVDLYWLLNGKGKFPINSEKNLKESNLTTQSKTSFSSDNESEIDRIVIFYKDGSFKHFEN